jgi:hypothetical protein
MNRLKGCAVAVAWLCCGSYSWAVVNGFVETFNGDGPYEGLDNPGWVITGDSTFEDGGLRFVNQASVDQFGRRLSGRGSFRAVIEFRDLFLGDLDLFSSDDAGGVLSLLYDFTPSDDTGDAISIGLSENTGTPPNEWTLAVSASGAGPIVGGSVPQAITTPVGLALVLVYDDMRRQFTVTYDNNVGDAIPPLEFGPYPFDRNIDESEQVINLAAYACCAFTMQSGLLDYFAVEPFSDISGDFNGNRVLDAGDIDELSARIRAATNDQHYDLNADSVIDDLDRPVWVHDLKQTYFGDADLSGTFDSTDLVQVLASGEYEDDIDLNSTWLTGDWDGDGDFTSCDLVVALADGGYEAAAVPEPAGVMLMAAAALLVTRNRSRPITRRTQDAP